MIIAFAAVFIASASPITPAIDTTRAPGAELTRPVPAPHRPTVCTEQYAPVCGRIGTVTKTFSNACFARAVGAKIIADGPCTK
ncbi:hypothetical protein ACFFWD_13100 [Bradyrhizobium erythrophlei]|uniref:hypothetical protein n=1 Tax=Bradyrhizobium erythrophlei TaxID=1437360 RepID=UPI0035E7A222